MSNLTSASGDQASVSSNQQSSFASPNPNQSKKKRNLPGNPDPDAQVVALSPKSLMATNRFVCEICGKGFQRDQNLQLHRRGHNLPWKLKQRSSKEVRKKVYICPEVSCVHHDPSRALGDLTGIKKHFSRKHGEKKWKCDKCSKKYAVQSDWKAHSKICGTREYRCDCGTLFSRRDSFITHRAFCDALAEESARSSAANPLDNQQHNHFFFPQPAEAAVHEPSHLQQTLLQGLQHQQQELSLKRDVPSWLDYSSENSLALHRPALMQAPAPPSSPHMSATALLQKAAEMGATLSRPSHLGHMAPPHSSSAAASSFGLGLSSSYGGSAAPALVQDMVMNSLGSTTPGFDGSFEDAILERMLGPRREASHNRSHGVGEEGSGGGNEGMTRDFLGLQAFPHRELLKLHGLDACMTTTTTAASSSYEQQHKKPWQA